VTEWLLDTNILSELRRPKPEPKVHTFIATQPLERLYVSTVTLAEIRFGIESAADPARRAALYDWLAQKIRPMFEGAGPPSLRRRYASLAASGRTGPQKPSYVLAT
jgi:predicted nucleic acid-binding protein